MTGAIIEFTEKTCGMDIKLVLGENADSTAREVSYAKALLDQMRNNLLTIRGARDVKGGA